MIVDITENDERGQVGIGTLIIFIAMVLVAAVAAGVLINTAGLLESKASDTGADSQAQVSNQIDVVTAVGEDVGTDGDVDTLNFTVKKSAGAGNLDLADATIEYLSDSERVSLAYNDTAADSSNFTTEVISGDANPVLDDSSERIKITLDLSSGTGINDELAEGEDATVRFVDQSGATTVYGVNVPDTISGETFVEV
ncbi:archaellin/type IV pilin N-terminal domain-containing protein [Haloarchaeobius sp. TZWWS8]|uniref:archaellin/type IV pilin N-terminal domain-containing protein n=1 Tax=Haloarchaeobius sp. TZWWS8 TaxID=3446121 RepID=UPI003EB698DA